MAGWAIGLCVLGYALAAFGASLFILRDHMQEHGPEVPFPEGDTGIAFLVCIFWPVTLLAIGVALGGGWLVRFCGRTTRWVAPACRRLVWTRAQDSIWRLKGK